MPLQYRDIQARQLKRLDEKLDRTKIIKAVIVDEQGNESGSGSIWANRNARRLWVREAGTSSNSQVPCYNIPSPVIGLPVILGYEIGSNVREILRTDRDFAGPTNDGTSWEAPDREDYLPGGRLQLWIASKMIESLATYPDDTGLIVNVTAGYYPYQGSREYFPGLANISLTQNPSAGEHYFAGLYLDSSNALQVVYGTSVGTGSDPPEPAWPVGAFRLSVVRVNDTQTSIVMAPDDDTTNDIFDRRIVWYDPAISPDALNNFTAVVDPTVNDDSSIGYSAGSLWVNIVLDTAWICKDATPTAAVWDQIDIAGTTLPVVDTQTIVKGSADDTKLIRFEVDGLTTLTTRILTVQDIDGTVLVTGGLDVPIADGGTGASTAQAAIDALTQVSGATNEHVLTKDTGTGNAIFKAAASGSANWPGPDKIKIEGTEYSTMATAIAAYSAGKQMIIGEGTFTCDDLTIIANTMILGSGKGVSIIQTTNNVSDRCLGVTGTANLQDLTIKIANTYDGIITAFNVSGVSQIHNCEFIATNAETTANAGSRGLQTNANAQIENVVCTATTAGTQQTDAYTAAGTGSLVSAFGCKFDGQDNDVVESTTSGLVKLVGCELVNGIVSGTLFEGAWIDWTPTVTQLGAVTKTINLARYKVENGLATVQMHVTITGSGTTSNPIKIGGQPTATVPALVNASGYVTIGAGLIMDNDIPISYFAAVVPISSTDWRFRQDATAGGVGATFGLASGDTISFSVQYPVA